MFPAILLPTLYDQNLDNKRSSNDLSSSLRSINCQYTLGLSKQISSLQCFANAIFHDLDIDFARIESRVSQISKHLSTLKSKANVFIQQSQSLDYSNYYSTDVINIQLPPLNNLSEGMPGQSEIFIQHASSLTKPPASLQAFSQILPNYEQMESEISDPLFYQKQLQDELRADLMKEMKNVGRRPSRQSKSILSNSKVYSSKALQNFLQDIPVPKIKVAIPPPIGETENWLQQANEVCIEASSQTVKQPIITSVDEEFFPVVQPKKNVRLVRCNLVSFNKDAKSNFVRQTMSIFSRDADGAVQVVNNTKGFIPKVSSDAINPPCLSYQKVSQIDLAGNKNQASSPQKQEKKRIVKLNRYNAIIAYIAPNPNTVLIDKRNPKASQRQSPNQQQQQRYRQQGPGVAQRQQKNQGRSSQQQKQVKQQNQGSPQQRQQHPQQQEQFQGLFQQQVQQFATPPPNAAIAPPPPPPPPAPPAPPPPPPPPA